MENKIKIKFIAKLKELRDELKYPDDSSYIKDTRKRTFISHIEICKIADDFLKINEFSFDDYHNYFESECLSLTMNDIEGFGINSDSPKLIDFMEELYNQITRIHLIKIIKETLPVLYTPNIELINLN
jgi:hypothetical protein